MPEKLNSQLEGPAGYNGSNPPGNATKLPTKHYSESQPKGNGKGTDIDTPAPKKGYC